MTSPSVVGILGVGHLSCHLVPGLLRTSPPPRLLLGHRGTATAAALAAEHGLPVAADSRDLVERSEVVLVAVRPAQIGEALAGLPWRRDQLVVSLCAGIPIAAIASLVSPAQVVRAMPVTSARFGESPTCLYPDEATARRLLEPAGPVIALAAEREFESASVIACYYGWVQRLIGEVAAWLERDGLDPATARTLVAAMTRAGAATVAGRRDKTPGELAAELVSPGSFTGQGFEVLDRAGAFPPWTEACAALLERMRARPRP